MTHQNAPVISPAELAAIIGKAQGKGFTPGGPVRAGIATDGDSFRPADFEAMARSAALPSPEPTPDTPPPAPVAVPARKAFSEPAPEPVRDFDAELAAARQEGHLAGHAEGLAQGRAEAKAESEAQRVNEMATARDIFLRAAKALSDPSPDLLEAIFSKVDLTIRRLAADRAGVMIDTHPEAFLHRIETLAERVSQGVRQIAVTLNPQDLEIISQHLGEGETDWTGLKADPTLNRGDVIITGAGISLVDLLDPTPRTSLR